MNARGARAAPEMMGLSCHARFRSRRPLLIYILIKTPRVQRGNSLVYIMRVCTITPLLTLLLLPFRVQRHNKCHKFPKYIARQFVGLTLPQIA